VLEEQVEGATYTPDRQFVWGLRYIDDLILRDRSVGGTLDERLFALQDANWNVTALVNISGAVQQRFAYSPYGVPLFLNADFTSGSNIKDWETLFCGYRWDATTSLCFIRHRSLHAVLGHWLERDPISHSDWTTHYDYANNGPMSFLDPLGLKVIILDVQKESKGDKQFEEAAFENYNKAIDEFLGALGKNVGQKEFDIIRDAGNVKFADTKFTGSLETYLAKVKREKESRIIRQNTGKFSDSLKMLSQAVSENTESYDRTLVAAHGTELIGGMQFVEEWVNPDEANKKLRGIGGKVVGKFAIVSCFNNTEQTEESFGGGVFAFAHRVALTGKSIDSSKSFIEFTPADVRKFLKDKTTGKLVKQGSDKTFEVFDKK
jgi:RHS repeat-associated protein